MEKDHINPAGIATSANLPSSVKLTPSGGLTSSVDQTSSVDDTSARTLSRRRLFAQSALETAGIVLLGSPALTRNTRSKSPIRAIAYNVLECKGWPYDKENAL